MGVRPERHVEGAWGLVTRWGSAEQCHGAPRGMMRSAAYEINQPHAIGPIPHSHQSGNDSGWLVTYSGHGPTSAAAMKRDELADLTAFVTIADEASFTRAAARMDTSQSALSYTIRRLEARLGVRLLNRTTRSVAPTEAGERLLGALRPALSSIGGMLDELSKLQEKPSGTVRITASRHAARTVLWPVISSLLPQYPDLSVEISVSGALTDIVTERFDAGVRLGEMVAADMIAVPIGPPLRMALVASPAYLQAHASPARPHDLTSHRCINIRMQSSGGLYAWEFEKDGRGVNVRVEGNLVLNDMDMVLQAAEEGQGMAFSMEDQVREQLKTGRLVRLLEDWCPPFPGYHLYYPSRRQSSAAFSLLVKALRDQHESA